MNAFTRWTLIAGALIMLVIAGELIVRRQAQTAASEFPSKDPSSGDFIGVAYYDRNNDGAVDWELHVPGCDDCDWALVDTDFNGRYDIHLVWGYSKVRKAADLPVAAGVPIRVAQTPPYGWSVDGHER